MDKSCSICNKIFDSNFSLYQHELNAHKDVKDKKEAASLPSSNIPKVTDGKFMEKHDLKWHQLYLKQQKDFKNLKANSDRKIEILNDQLKELKEFGMDSLDMLPLTSEILQSSTINHFAKISNLVNNNQFALLTRSQTYLKALQKLFQGVVYGIIPLTYSQKKALSDKELNIIRKTWKSADLSSVQKSISANRMAVKNIIKVLDESIKFIAKTYALFPTESV